MTNQQILEKAIQKAIDGGWKLPVEYEAMQLSYSPHTNDYYFLACGEYSAEVETYPELFIFNHDFAKALWGDKEYTEQNEWDLYRMKKWEAHLMLMVIADDPIKYLGEHLA